MRALRTIRTLFLALFVSAIPAASFAGIFLSVSFGPPALPVYEQPLCPGDGYIWTPGYWAYGPEGYYWVPGTWVLAPAPGLLWTPGYWGWGGGLYIWHAGYWGPHVGFYGGINYGFGYPGVGFIGGRWVGGRFAYNTAVVRVNTTIVHNTYVDRTVIRNTVVTNRASFNGPGGITAQPTARENAAFAERRFAATSQQTAHEHSASLNRANFAAANHGRPANPAVSRPMGYSGQGSRPAYNGYHPQTAQPRSAPGYNTGRPAYSGSRPQNTQARPNQPAARAEQQSRPAHESAPKGDGDDRRR